MLCSPGVATHSFLGPANVLSHVPVLLRHYDAWQEFPCCAELGYQMLVRWDWSLLGFFRIRTVWPSVNHSGWVISISSRFIYAARWSWSAVIHALTYDFLSYWYWESFTVLRIHLSSHTQTGCLVSSELQLSIKYHCFVNSLVVCGVIHFNSVLISSCSLAL